VAIDIIVGGFFAASFQFISPFYIFSLIDEAFLLKITSDFLVIGSGIAGLSYALKVAERGTVALITKRDMSETATNLAQGGIASVISTDDSFASHFKDTMVAGANLSREEVVQLVVESGPKAIYDLINWGVKFTKNDDDTYDLTREGGHRERLIPISPFTNIILLSI